MITIRIDPAFRQQLDSELLSTAAHETLDYSGADVNSNLAVAVTGDTRLRRLNRQFLGEDRPTDVLSFPSGETNPEDGTVYLGDVIISYPRACQQAEVGHHPVVDELRLLVVHGVLHLLGHDHAEPEQKARMWSAQADILTRLGASITSPGEGYRN